MSERMSRAQSRPRVRVRWDPEREAHLIQRGPEVSEIKWVDTEKHQYIINEHFIVEERE